MSTCDRCKGKFKAEARVIICEESIYCKNGDVTPYGTVFLLHKGCFEEAMRKLLSERTRARRAARAAAKANVLFAKIDEA